MKKKFIAVSVLLCALALSSTTLTSCVDDNESASVTAIRDAKAAQLTALANYQQAQADAEKIVSEATAAIKNAEARWQEIQNDLKDLELQQAQATLETDIEAAKAKAEAALMEQQAALEAAKVALIKAMDQADIATQWKINNLLNAANAIMYGGYYYLGTTEYTYTDPEGGVTTETHDNRLYIYPSESIAGTGGLQSQLISKQGELITAKYELEDGKSILSNLLTQENENLAYNQALLAEYEKYKNATKEDAQKALDEARAAEVAIVAAAEEASKLYNNEEDKITAAETKIDQTEVGKFITTAWAWDSDNGQWKSPEDNTLYTTYIENDDTYDNVDPIKFTYDDGTAGVLPVSYDVKKRVLKADVLTQDIEKADLNIEAAKKALETAKEQRDEALKATNTNYKAKKDAVDAAQEAFDENPQDVTIPGGTGKALADAKADLKQYEDNAEGWVTSAETTVAEKEAAKKTLTDFQTLMTGDTYKAYETVYAEYIKVVDAANTVKVAEMKAGHNQEVQAQLIDDLQTYVWDYYDWESAIQSTNEDINDNKENIEKLEAGLYSDYSTNSEKALQNAISVIEQQIAALETRIAQKQAEYNSYIEQAEALIQGEEAPAPETPAEGEETPAE